MLFLKASYLPPNPGDIINLTTGKKIGDHSGLWAYTIGQKARIPGMLQKMFVARKDSVVNALYVVPGKSVSSFLSSTDMIVDSMVVGIMRPFTWMLSISEIGVGYGKIIPHKRSFQIQDSAPS
jgi:tRNA U34 2-thiouridine synthase MnmA/TrmU